MTRPATIHVPSVPRSFRGGIASIAWIGFGVALTLSGGCGSGNPFPAETAALKTLTDQYQLQAHTKNKDGHVIDLRLEGPKFDDAALALVGQFPELESMSLRGSSVTDEGLEKLPVLRNLNRVNLTAPKITDHGLAALGKQPSLQHVWVEETPTLTAKGRETLKKANPAINIHVVKHPKRKA